MIIIDEGNLLSVSVDGKKIEIVNDCEKHQERLKRFFRDLRDLGGPLDYPHIVGITISGATIVPVSDGLFKVLYQVGKKLVLFGVYRGYGLGGYSPRIRVDGLDDLNLFRFRFGNGDLYIWVSESDSEKPVRFSVNRSDYMGWFTTLYTTYSIEECVGGVDGLGELRIVGIDRYKK